MTILQVRNISKSFGGVRALNELSFEVEENQITGLIGPNGSGKTVTFDIITGFTKPDSGSVYFQGRAITGMKPHKIARLGLGRSFQLVKLFPNMRVRDILVFSSQTKDLRRQLEVFIPRRQREDAERKIEEVARFLGISQLMEERAVNLSYGQQKLVEIASLLVMRPEPKLLLLDEPAAGLAEHEVRNIKNILAGLKGLGKTFLIIEHNMFFIMDICEKIIVLNYGVKIAEGAPEEVRRKTEVVEAYLGSDYRA
ncbi:MAG: ABC transporter ATP-binding protein [Candidatus Caldarchaeum sp.]|nr:ABC transporter ATP-binding protein [Candidatus Caldarchaeum sp.]